MYLYGASGHGKVVAEIAEENGVKIKAFIDADASKRKILDYDVIHEIPSDKISMLISVGNNTVRKKIAEKYPALFYKTLVHPKAIVSRRAEIGSGTVVMGGVTINSEVKIGKHCIINTNTSIDHDCILGDYVHISPNASLAGNVTVGDGSHIGIGAAVIQGITIGKWCMIGAGAVVIKDIPDGVTVVGNPGKIVSPKSD